MRFIGRFCHYIILYLPFLVIFLFYFASEQRIQPIDYEKQQETLSCNFIFAFIDWKCFICSQGKEICTLFTRWNIESGNQRRKRTGLPSDAWNDTILSHSNIGLVLENGTIVGKTPRITGERRRKIKDNIESPFYRFKEFVATGNELDLKLKGGFGIIFRAYNEGVAYRFYTTQSSDIIIKEEQAEFNFKEDYTAYLPYTTNDKKPMVMAYQNVYDITPLSKAQPKLAFLPVTVDCGSVKLTLLESDLEAYPGMFVQSQQGKYGLKGVFAPYPAKTDFYPWRKQEYVTETTDFISRSRGSRSYPWRVLAITEKDTDMPVNNLVYALASPNRIGDTSWIKTGKVAWDWWNDWNLKGVPFKAGINMDTYKYYIDFASRNGLEFIVLDEGWYDPKSGDMLTVIPELDLPELIAYGKSKGVEIVLWTVFNVLDSQLEAACKKYADMGIKGFKVDFLDRDDQTAVEWCIASLR